MSIRKRREQARERGERMVQREVSVVGSASKPSKLPCYVLSIGSCL